MMSPNPMEYWRQVFHPILIRSTYVDDRIDDMWVDDIMPIQKIRRLYQRWHINSLIAHYLDRSILDTIPEKDHDEFFKLLKEEIDNNYIITGGAIDRSYSSKEV